MIPKELQADLLDLVHEGHPGILGILDQLREPVLWPGMTRDFDELVKMCNLVFAAAYQGI